MKIQYIIFPRQGKSCNVSPFLPFLLALTVFFLSSCATVQVSQDYDPGYAFDKLKTYTWNTTIPYENGDLLERDELLAKRFKAAVEETLAKRGFIQAAQASFMVSCTYTITSRLETDVFDSGVAFGFGRYGRYGGIGMNTGSSVRQYDQGTLVISIHSAATGQLVWKGTGTSEVFMHSTPDEITRNVYAMVGAVLAQFPPEK